LSEALNAIDQSLDLRCIVAFTASGYSAQLAAEERPKALVVGLTPDRKVYHRLNLIWGLMPVLIDQEVETFEDVVQQAEASMMQRQMAAPGDRILIMGGIPMSTSGGTNFLKIHQIKG
jgi:pyruvate kinase